MRPLTRGVFGIVAAVSAATFADPVVEYCSNAGLFGPGNFTDHSTADVVPALLAALGLALAFVFMRARGSLARGFSRLERYESAFVRLPFAFGCQMVVLFAMESIEQLVIVGHPLGGTIWLGGPIVVALAIHASILLVVDALLRRGLDSLTRLAVTVARAFRAFVERLSAEANRPYAVVRDRFVFKAQNALAARSGKRAPPLSA